jgi:hypothetical protein
MTRRTNPRTVAWVNQETERLALEGKTPGSRLERELVEHWRYNRPKMYRQLLAAGVLEKMAFVLYEKMYQSTRVYIQGGLPYPDAQEEAVKDWLIWEPEAEERRNRRHR